MMGLSGNTEKMERKTELTVILNSALTTSKDEFMISTLPLNNPLNPSLNNPILQGMTSLLKI